MIYRGDGSLRLLPLLFAGLLIAPVPVSAQPANELYQDFRGKRPLLPSFRLEGPDGAAEAKPEDGGLRVTLAATRPDNRAVHVCANFALIGDFELTGTYELLSADQPTKGYGVGVSLNVASTNSLKKFAKVSRLMRPNTGSRLVYECWDKDNPKDHQLSGLAATTQSGQLRLVRQGASMFFLVSDGPGKEFTQIFEKKTFGTDNLEHLRFQVTDGNSPGYAVDARLIDLRVRHGLLAPEKAMSPPRSRRPPPLNLLSRNGRTVGSSRCCLSAWG